MNQAQVKSSCL